MITYSDLNFEKQKTFSRRAFSVADPDIWNSLPPEIKQTENFATFKKKLKTHLFDSALSPF